jgi:hypothetical protein
LTLAAGGASTREMGFALVAGIAPTSGAATGDAGSVIAASRLALLRVAAIGSAWAGELELAIRPSIHGAGARVKRRLVCAPLVIDDAATLLSGLNCAAQDWHTGRSARYGNFSAARTLEKKPCTLRSAGAFRVM